MRINTCLPTLLLLPALGLLGACANTPPLPPTPSTLPAARIDAQRQADFDRSQSRWHGAKLQELVSKLGKPSSSARTADGGQVYSYAKTATIKGPDGPSTFSCVVHYQIEARSERIVGHQIEGC